MQDPASESPAIQMAQIDPAIQAAARAAYYAIAQFNKAKIDGEHIHYAEHELMQELVRLFAQFNAFRDRELNHYRSECIRLIHLIPSPPAHLVAPRA